MAQPLRMTRRFPGQMTETGYRRLRQFSSEHGLSEGEALSFLFENLDSVINADNFGHRLTLYQKELARRRG